ncbi:hypothetical protein O6H91_02G108300 [Diphasiastrum complanatum]|nr:hypothetical protein O6H91_02G108300 [Diphasiastrum complanatum]
MADWDTSHLFVDDEDEQENDDYAVEGETSKDLIIFLVDVGRDMFLEFDEEDAGKSYFDVVIESIIEDLKARIISRDSDKVGICFYNSREKKNPLESDSVYILRDIEELSAGFIKEVSSMKDRFGNEIGSQRGVKSGSRESSLYNAIWVSQGMFSKTAAKNHGKRIFIFTNNDDPFEDVDPSLKADLKRTTIQRAKDANDLGISIELYALSRPGEEFNVNIFYKDIVQLDDEDTSQFMIRSKQRFNDLVQQMRKKIMKKRTIRKIMLTLPTGQSIGLKTFAMVRPARPGSGEWLDSSTNTPLKIERSFICSDTGSIMNESLKRFQEYNNKKIIFTIDEVAQVKNVTNVQLQLLGFKPISCLKDYHNLRPPTFLYPNDETISGSTCAFVALHRALLRFQK